MSEEKKKNNGNGNNKKVVEAKWEKSPAKKPVGVKTGKNSNDRKKPETGAENRNTASTKEGRPLDSKKKDFGKNGSKDNGKKQVMNGKKPWEMMQQGGAKKQEKKPVKEFKSFLYLLPKRTSAKDLAKVLEFLPKEKIEVWEDECVLEISAGEAVITFEDIRDSLEKEDEKVLNSLRMKQVLACDYESTDAELVRKTMGIFLKTFQGKIGSDTEDFEPFLNLEEI